MKGASGHANLADVARLAGCTAASVSLVLNNSPLPSARMRERVRKAAAQLSYVPNRMARSLKRGRTFTLGVVMPYCADSYVAAFMDALSVEASDFGFQLEIHFHRWSAQEEDRALQALGESRAEGIFLSAARRDYRQVATLTSLKNQRIPIIHIGRRVQPEFTSNIVGDMFGGAVGLGAHLAALGHQRIDFLEPVFHREAAESMLPEIQLILDGLREGARRHRKNPHIGFFETNPEYLLARRDIEHHGFSAKMVDDLTGQFLQDYLMSQPTATAVVTSSLVRAWKLLGALTERGRQCPGDISVASFGIENAGAMGAVPLTTAEIPVEFRARKAITIMMAALSGQKVASEILVPATLVERTSTSAPNRKIRTPLRAQHPAGAATEDALRPRSGF